MKIFENYLTPPYNKIFWCSYFLRYVCDDCYNEDYSIIPIFVLIYWDFSKFSISKKAKELLTKYYKEPIINIKATNELIHKSSNLKRCIVLKRKIHRIFDLILCQPEELALNFLGDYKYLVLNENMFSLNDLSEIHNLTFYEKIYEIFIKFENHVLYECKVCEYKGKNCFNCNNDEKLKAWDIDNSFFCKICLNIYHRKCSLVHLCNIEPFN